LKPERLEVVHSAAEAKFLEAYHVALSRGAMDVKAAYPYGPGRSVIKCISTLRLKKEEPK